MNKKANLEKIFSVSFGIIFLSIIIFLFIYNLNYMLTSGEEEIIIDEKWIKRNGDNEKYLISSLDNQVFEITDSIYYWRFDSSNMYNYIKEGDKCFIKTQGFRFPLMSDYKNIIGADCNILVNIEDKNDKR